MILIKYKLLVERILFCKDFLWFTADIIPTNYHKNWHIILLTIRQICQFESHEEKIIHICPR